MPAVSERITVTNALAGFQTHSLRKAASDLLGALGYRSDRVSPVPDSSPHSFLESFAQSGAGGVFDQEKALVPDWKSADLLFQLTDQELSRESSLFTDNSVKAGLLKSYVFIAIELKGCDYARGKFSAIARQINRIFPMPVMVLFKCGADIPVCDSGRRADRNVRPTLTIAVINRRVNKIDASKDVLGKVTLIREIDFAQPHRGHLDILASLALPALVHPQKKPISDFDTLHAAWEQIFNVELLNERFYRELANWYFWALPQVEFPADLEPDDEKRRATGLLGNTYEVSKIFMDKIPVKKPTAGQAALFERLVPLVQLAKRIGEDIPASFLEDLIDACVMECYFREHMAERDLLFHDTLAPLLASVEQTFLSASPSFNTDRNVCATFLTHLHQTLNAPSHPIRNRLLRLTADSPDLLAVIKQEGRV